MEIFESRADIFITLRNVNLTLTALMDNSHVRA